MKRYILPVLVCILFFACSEDKNTVSTPTTFTPKVSTDFIDDVQTSKALISSTVLYEGNKPITQRGICWALTQNPGMSDSTVTAGSGKGAYSVKLEHLTPRSTYFVRSYAVLENSERIWGQQVSFTTPGVDVQEMVFLEGGSFQMGCSSANSDVNAVPAHSVTLSSFNISRFEISQEEWSEVMPTNPSIFKDPLKPVENISWLDCIVYCNLRSLQEDLNPVYTYAGLGSNPNAWNWKSWTVLASDSISCNWAANGYRLPTEAEWEYAARAGQLCNFDCCYSGSDCCRAVAWVKFNSGGITRTPGSRAPNRAFLYDMTGNVWEWVWDRYAAYGSAAVTNPTGPTTGQNRIRRGGSWLSDESWAKLSSRCFSTPNLKTGFIGLRIARNAM